MLLLSDYVTSLSSKEKLKGDSIQLFISCSGATGKPHLARTATNTSNLEKPRVLLLRPTGIYAVIINSTTLHLGLGTKPGAKFIGLNDKTEANLIIKFLEVKIIIINEISMVCRDLFYKIHARFMKIFMC